MEMEMEPRELGNALEGLIHIGANKIPGLTLALRENDIKKWFSDNSLNGVDHWFVRGNTHILCQTKWKDKIEQREIAQFLQCVYRIRSRLPANYDFHLIWITKTYPTANSVKTLHEGGSIIIQCDLNINSLARKVILQLNDYFGTDPSNSLEAITANAIHMKPLLAFDRINHPPPIPPPIPPPPPHFEYTAEEMEILQIRRELAEKKKYEEEQARLEETKVHDLLTENCGNNNIAIYIGSVYNTRVNEWNPGQISVKEILAIPDIINTFISIITPKIHHIINEYMKELWNTTNTTLPTLTEDTIHHFTNGMYKNLKTKILTTLSEGDDSRLWFHQQPWNCSPPRPQSDWKAHVAIGIFTPIIDKEYYEWNFYCRKYVKLAKCQTDFMSPLEARKKIQQLEEENGRLLQYYEKTEKKLAIIQTALRS